MEVSTEVSFFLRLRAIDFMCYGFWTCWMAISYLVGIFANSLFFFFFFSNYIIGMWACAGDMETFFSCLIIFFDWVGVLFLI